ncbi:MAG: hypothetical protein BWK76_08400 [Desulfobulbaceae bacterium A2]|nr:MAG: hypothetical protein BWK76_08400 [Desulfobulbaceae bacterium A2]
MTQCKLCLAEMKPSLEHRAVTEGLCRRCLATLAGTDDAASAGMLLEAIDAPVLLMQPNPKLVFAANRKALALFDKERDAVEARRGGEVFNCLQSFTQEGCGKHSNCEPCRIRLAVVGAFEEGKSSLAVSTQIDVRQGDDVSPYAMQVSTEPVGEMALLRIDGFKKM